MSALTPVESSHIAAIGYDAATQTLLVEFKGRGTTAYDKVPPDVHEAFMAAESKGKYFGTNVRGKYGHRPLAREPEPAS